MRFLSRTFLSTLSSSLTNRVNFFSQKFMWNISRKYNEPRERWWFLTFKEFCLYFICEDASIKRCKLCANSFCWLFLFDISVKFLKVIFHSKICHPYYIPSRYPNWIPFLLLLSFLLLSSPKMYQDRVLQHLI